MYEEIYDDYYFETAYEELWEDTELEDTESED